MLINPNNKKENNLIIYVNNKISEYEKQLNLLEVLYEEERSMPIQNRRNFPAIIFLNMHKKVYTNALTELNAIKKIIEWENSSL